MGIRGAEVSPQTEGARRRTGASLGPIMGKKRTPDRLQPDQCPACRERFDARELPALTLSRCPNCGQMVFVPRQIGAWLLFEPIGAGGMASVYRAMDTKGGPDVAVKLLRMDRDPGPAERAEFAHEAEVGETLDHPNMVKIHRHGVDQGTPYMVMELVLGQRLDQRLQQRTRLAEAEALEITRQVAEGLTALHRKNMIHGDVKPKNVLITAEGVAKLFDFGLARPTNTEEAHHARPATGEIVGTPYYLPPERTAHQPEDRRADQYSLGATLFHLLAGRPPIEEGTAGEVALKQARQPLLGIRAYARDISAATADLVSRMLKKDPAQRYQTDQELLEAIRDALGQAKGSPDLRTSEEDEPRRGGDPLKGGRTIAIAIALIVLLLVLALLLRRGAG